MGKVFTDQKLICGYGFILNIPSQGKISGIGKKCSNYWSENKSNSMLKTIQLSTGQLTCYSPDLNPCDFYLWGFLKSRVYSDPYPQTLGQQ